MACYHACGLDDILFCIGTVHTSIRQLVVDLSADGGHSCVLAIHSLEYSVDAPIVWRIIDPLNLCGENFFGSHHFWRQEYPVGKGQPGEKI
jgi:hypothetical protein